MKNRFGGVGVYIMAYRTKFEIELNLLSSLTDEIGKQNAVAAKAWSVFNMSFERNIVAAKDELHKLSAATDFAKNLTACNDLLLLVSDEQHKLATLVAKYHEAKGRAEAALPDYAMFFSNGREDTIPGRTFFIAGKGEADQFKLPAQKPAVAMASFADTVLARRFQK